MADKFRERFKIDCPVPMSIKWKDTDKSVLEKKIVLQPVANLLHKLISSAEFKQSLDNILQCK